MPYRIKNDGAAVISDGFSFTSVQLRDAAAGEGDTVMRRYFEDSYGLFLRQLERLHVAGRPLTEQEKSELLFLLKAIIKENDVMYGQDR